MAHTIHIEKWAKRNEEDFYMLFVGAWIPFNAWYHKEIAPRCSSKRDRDNINFIAQNPNTYKNKILSYLNGRDRESLRFQQELVDLHKALELHAIPDDTEPITFKTTTIFDAPSLIQQDFYKSHYKIERTPRGSGYNYDVLLEDKNTHAVKYRNNFATCDAATLEADPNFMRLTEAIRNKLKDEFLAVGIKAPRNVILEPIVVGGVNRKPQHSIELGDHDKQYFIDNRDKIAQVLIQLIYNLRCQIFHGSLDPTEANMVVYQHAYQIQRMLIKELY